MSMICHFFTWDRVYGLHSCLFHVKGGDIPLLDLLKPAPNAPHIFYNLNMKLKKKYINNI